MAMAKTISASERLIRAIAHPGPGSGASSRWALGVIAGVLLGFDFMAILDSFHGTSLLPPALSEGPGFRLLMSANLLMLAYGFALYLERRPNRAESSEC